MNDKDLEKQRLEEEERKRQERVGEQLEQSLERVKQRRKSYNDERVDRDEDYYD
jgi:hypothetical protein